MPLVVLRFVGRMQNNGRSMIAPRLFDLALQLLGVDVSLPGTERRERCFNVGLRWTLALPASISHTSPSIYTETTHLCLPLAF